MMMNVEAYETSGSQNQISYNMRCFVMFVTAVCSLLFNTQVEMAEG